MFGHLFCDPITPHILFFVPTVTQIPSFPIYVCCTKDKKGGLQGRTVLGRRKLVFSPSMILLVLHPEEQLSTSTLETIKSIFYQLIEDPSIIWDIQC